MKKTLLISGLGGALFPYLHDHLVSNFDVYYLDSDESLLHVYPELNFFLAPKVTDDAYWELVKRIISEKKIDFYIPLIDEEILPAHTRIGDFEGVKLVSPSFDFCELSLNKLRLMEELRRLGISSIQSYRGDAFQWEIGPPVFVKPIFGRGSRGIRLINSKEQLDAYYVLENYQPGDILIQGHISGTEYTVGATISPANEVLEVSVKKVIKKKGITQIAVTEHNPAITAVVERVVYALNPAGPINIQLFVTPTNEIKIFEINPRFSTTTIMSYAAGIDVVSLYIHYLVCPFQRNSYEPREGLFLHRRWESLFYEK